MNTNYENMKTVLNNDTKITTLQDLELYNNEYPLDNTKKKMPNSYSNHTAFDMKSYINQYVNNFGFDLEVLECFTSGTSSNGVVLKVYAKKVDKTYVLVHCALNTAYKKGTIIKQGDFMCNHLKDHIHIYVLKGRTTDIDLLVAEPMGQWLVYGEYFGLPCLFTSTSTTTPPPAEPTTPKTFKAVRKGKSTDNGTFYFDEKYYSDFKDKKQSAIAYDTTGAKWNKDTTWTEVYAPAGGSSTSDVTTCYKEGKAVRFYTKDWNNKSIFKDEGAKRELLKDLHDLDDATQPWLKGTHFDEK